MGSFLYTLFELKFLYFRVLQLMNLVDSRIAQYACEKLDLSILSFFEQFRKIYVGDQVPKMSKVRLKIDQPENFFKFIKFCTRNTYICKCISWSKSCLVYWFMWSNRGLQMLADPQDCRTWLHNMFCGLLKKIWWNYPNWIVH